MSHLILQLSKKSKNLFFSSDVTVFSLHEQHDASLNFWFRTHIILAKNVPWHILTPSAVACDMFLLRASAHHWHVSAFLCNREFQGISYYIKKGSHRVLFYPSHFFTFCQNFCFCLKCLICFYTLDDGRLFCAFNAFNSSNTTSFRTLM